MLPIAQFLRELRFVEDVIRRAIIARKLVIVIHLDRIKGTELCTETAVHANINVNEERFWLRHRVRW